MRMIFAGSLLAVFALIATTGPAAAYSPEEARNSLASDLAECAAYFTISAVGLERAGPKKVSDDYHKAAQVALDLSASMSKPETARARLQLALRSQMRRIDHSYDNIAILMVDYSDQCKAILERPADRLQYWLNKQ